MNLIIDLSMPIEHYCVEIWSTMVLSANQEKFKRRSLLN